MNCRFPRKHAIMRMFCFPWAGGTTAYYTALGEEITEDLEVHAMCLPGRENRFNEDHHTCFKDLIDEVVQIIHEKYWDKPFVFFGHSMGALISFFVAMELKRLYNREPVCMIMSGTTAPNYSKVLEKRMRIKDYPDRDSFINRIQELGGTPSQMNDHPELWDIFYPILKSDFILLEEMIYTLPDGATPPLSCPVEWFDGDQDQDHMVDEWRKLTSGTLTSRKLPGAHFYLMEPESRKKLISFFNMKFEDYGDYH